MSGLLAKYITLNVTLGYARGSAAGYFWLHFLEVWFFEASAKHQDTEEGQGRAENFEEGGAETQGPDSVQ